MGRRCWSARRVRATAHGSPSPFPGDVSIDAAITCGRGPFFARRRLATWLELPSVRPLSLRPCFRLAASLVVMPFLASHAQRAPGPAGATGDRPIVGLHDSIDVASLEYAGALAVSKDDLKRVVFTRTSSCRLPFLIPLCKVS